jgi:hypothetical protein
LLASKEVWLVRNAGRTKAKVKIGEAVWPDYELLAMDDLSDISHTLGQQITVCLTKTF